MKVLHLTICAILSFLALSKSYAQKPITDSISVANDKTEMRQNVWKHRSTYINLGYGMQTSKGSPASLKSDMAFALVVGHTYYLHKKPIAELLKFGLDLNYCDLNYAQYPDFQKAESAKADTDLPDLGIKQIDLGIGLGPSLTVNPVDHLKICAYFHVTPSYSLLLQNSETYSHYTTFFNVGLTAAYKVIQLGFEARWCSATRYGAASFGRTDNVYDENGNFHDPFENIDVKKETTTCRFFIGFRF